MAYPSFAPTLNPHGQRAGIDPNYRPPALPPPAAPMNGSGGARGSNGNLNSTPNWMQTAGIQSGAVDRAKNALNQFHVASFNDWYGGLSDDQKVQFQPTPNSAGPGRGGAFNTSTTTTKADGSTVSQRDIHMPGDLTDDAVAGVVKDNAKKHFMQQLILPPPSSTTAPSMQSGPTIPGVGLPGVPPSADATGLPPVTRYQAESTRLRGAVEQASALPPPSLGTPAPMTREQLQYQAVQDRIAEQKAEAEQRQKQFDATREDRKGELNTKLASDKELENTRLKAAADLENQRATHAKELKDIQIKAAADAKAKADASLVGAKHPEFAADVSRYKAKQLGYERQKKAYEALHPEANAPAFDGKEPDYPDYNTPGKYGNPVKGAATQPMTQPASNVPPSPSAAPPATQPAATQPTPQQSGEVKNWTTGAENPYQYRRSQAYNLPMATNNELLDAKNHADVIAEFLKQANGDGHEATRLAKQHGWRTIGAAQ